MNKLYRFFILAGLVNGTFISSLLAQGEFYVYSDKFDNGFPSGVMGSENGKSMTINPDCKESPLKGEYCLKIEATGSEPWCGVFIQQGGTWKGSVDSLNPLVDLTNKKYLVFSIRADKESKIAKIGMGEGDDAVKSEGNLVIGTKWQRYVFEIPPKGLKRVNGLFLVVFEGAGLVYLDEIFYAGSDFKPDASDLLYAERSEPLDPTSFYVYSDKFDNGIPSGYSGQFNGTSIKLDDNWRSNPYKGPKCIKIVTNNLEGWRGLYTFYNGKWYALMNEKDKTVDLSDYDKLEFYARSDSDPDNPYILSSVGIGNGGGTEEIRFETVMEIGNKWEKHTINLKGADLTKINTLFYFWMPIGTLYLDEIRYIKKKEKAK